MNRQGDIAIADILVGPRIRKEIGDITPLAESIKRVGLLHPVVLNKKRELLCGFRRREAARELGWKTIPYRIAENVDDILSALHAEMGENTCRKSFTLSEAVTLGRRIEEFERGEAEARRFQAEGKPRGEKVCSGKLPEQTGDTRDKIGAAIGLSGRTYEKGKAVLESGDKELISEMDAKGKVSAAYGKLQAKQGKQKAKPEKPVGLKKARSVIETLRGVPLDDPERELGFREVESFLLSQFQGGEA